jgi:hypothetical protein
MGFAFGLAQTMHDAVWLLHFGKCSCHVPIVHNPQNLITAKLLFAMW